MEYGMILGLLKMGGLGWAFLILMSANSLQDGPFRRVCNVLRRITCVVFVGSLDMISASVMKHPVLTVPKLFLVTVIVALFVNLIVQMELGTQRHYKRYP
ncbi:MAG: hypothetical protein WAW92_01870 [Minisyncoccia bacterium]